MKIINKLTLRHMKLNKRRTFVTMIGIIISVAMITAVSTVAYSIMDYMARDAMETEGRFHLKLSNYYYKDNEKIIDELDAENYALMKPIGDYVYADNEDGSVDIEPYVYDENADEIVDAFRIVAVQDNFYEMQEIELIEGHYPENGTEILLSVSMNTVFGYKELGDTITIGGNTYTVCGLISGYEFEWRELSLPMAMTHPIYTRLDTDTLQDDDLISGYFYAGGILDNLEEQAEELQQTLQSSGVPQYELIGEDETWFCDGVGINYNYRVLMYLGLSQYDNINFVMEAFKLILIVIIMVGSVSLIANGFIISISERSRYLGMLASVGATKKQKRSSVYFEGFFEGIIAIPFGILAGIGGIAITFKCIMPLIRELSGSDTELCVVVNGSVIIWTVVFSVLTIFLSAYFPAKRASKISAIDAIRQSKDVKITSKSVKTSGITRKIFGFEGELALKNLKRNKKRYRVTVFSMFISLTLFISVYSLVYYMKESVYFEMGEVGYDIYITPMTYSVNSESIDDIGDDNENNVESDFINMTDQLLEKGSAYIDKAQRYIDIRYNGSVPELKMGDLQDYFNDDYWSYLKKCDMTHWTPSIYMVSMNEKDLKAYLDGIGISYDDFVSDKDNIILFDGMRQTVYAQDDRLVYYGDVLDNKLQTLQFQYTIYEESIHQDEAGNIYTAFEEKGVKDIDFNIYSREDKFMGLSEYIIYILITPEKLEELADYGTMGDYYIALDVNDDKKTVELYEDILATLGYDESDYQLYNYTEQVEVMENSMLLISVFVYGFIILMSLICIANIVNTISTSLALRRKEFAMLKSVGMTDRAFNKMIAYESAFYGIKAVIFGLPVGTAVMLLIRYFVTDSFDMELGIPWMGYLIAIIGVFAVIGVTMLYSSRKIKKANVIEALRDENV